MVDKLIRGHRVRIKSCIKVDKDEISLMYAVAQQPAVREVGLSAEELDSGFVFRFPFSIHSIKYFSPLFDLCSIK
ncbi:hypothetical protein QL285_081947 [Trifolium repens]|nr:hypothetical protein QL285_081947 [Trifolium repens]